MTTATRPERITHQLLVAERGQGFAGSRIGASRAYRGGMPHIIPVDDRLDPRLEPYRDIRERDLVGRAGLFLAEGKVVIEKVIDSPRFRLESLLVAAHRLDSLADMLARVDAATPVFAAAQGVLDAIAGFPLHRGLVAVGRRVDLPDAAHLLAALPARATILILSGIANHDNMGGIFRNAAAFGVQAVLLDHSCCDPLYRKAIRVSVGAILLVPFARLSRDADVLALLAKHRFRAVALSPAGKVTLSDLAPANRNAVLLGAEGPGLAADLLNRATSVRIPMASGFDSLNVATASGIVLHHLASGI
jgi:tRNA G18 (ribose-2'-O)-methylase SpoU